MAGFNITAPLSPFRNVGRNGSGARLEIINRTGQGTDVLNRALAKVPAADNSGDADFRFGKASRFTLTTPEQATNPGGSVTWPPADPADDPADGIVINDYDYVDRSVEVIKVEQEGEPDNWVEVERILKLLMINRKTREYVRFNFDWSKKPSESHHA